MPGEASVIPAAWVRLTVDELMWSREGSLTVALADAPARIELQNALNHLCSQRGGAGKHIAHAAQVVLGHGVPVGDDVYQQGRHDAQLLDFEALDGVQEGCWFEFGQHDDLVAAVVAEQRDQCEAVDVAEGQDADADLGLDAELLAGDGLDGRNLHDVGYDVEVRDHDGFL